MTRLKRNGVQFLNADDVVAKRVGGHGSHDELSGVKGFTPTDRSKAVLVNDRIADHEALGVLKHELVHKNLPTLLKEDRFKALTQAVSKS